MDQAIFPKKDVIKSVAYTVFLAVIFVLFSWQKNTGADILIALPFFVVLYFLFFSIGKPAAGAWYRSQLQENVRRVFLFPLLLLILFYGYLACNGVNPLDGTLFLVPYLLFFPVLAYAARDNKRQAIDWFDFVLLFLFFFPVTLVKVDPSGNLPFHGGGFDSVYRITVMLAAIFAFSVVRNLQDVGAYPVFRWRYLFTTIWVWAVFYVLVLVIGCSVNFIKPGEQPSWDMVRIEAIARRILSIFLHTALFEELVFRGLLQNMLQKRIKQTSWKPFWIWGGVILFGLSLLAGYGLKGGMQWFPALVTVVLFGIAWLIEKKQQSFGVYTALAITSVIFGLVHFHSGSIIFTGLASVGGWAYGYVYLKTKNIFYAALLHALVNATPLIFGLELAK